jgi:hypothetical protein
MSNREQVVGKKLVVTVFGNEVERRDSLAVKLVPELKKKLPNVDFVVVDPTESVEPPKDGWVILDVGEGIHEVTVIEDIHQLEHNRGDSVHDYDAYMELSLLHKLGRLPAIKLVVIPNEMGEMQALKETVRVMQGVLEESPR